VTGHPHNLPPLTPRPLAAAHHPSGEPGTNPAVVPPVDVIELSDEEYDAALKRRDARLEYERTRLPRLGEIIRDAERLCAQLINLLGEDYDPKSALNVEAYPGESLVDVELAKLRSDAREMLRGLADLAGLRHPPVGSAVKQGVDHA
jgi:hypothetical protein